jgi:hypothetical protein
MTRQTQWANDEKATALLPAPILQLAKKHRLAFGEIFNVVEKTLVVLGEPLPLCHESSLRLRIEDNDQYLDDGNTRTPGRRYTLVWIYELLAKKSSDYRNNFDSWYRNKFECAIAHSMEVSVRDQDERVREDGWSLYFGGLTFDHEREKKCDRIDYGNSAVPHATEVDTVAILVEGILKMRQRVKLMSVIEAAIKIVGYRGAS